ncbi:hypothetical protein, partial [Actinophytocola sp.]|uniref:hypothetical protein n=1 Tax=Actinophytocola sp. TaxID=1872138 RepID=UPI003D6B70C6
AVRARHRRTGASTHTPHLTSINVHDDMNDDIHTRRVHAFTDPRIKDRNELRQKKHKQTNECEMKIK